MSTYVMETRQPERELCPFHELKFKKHGKFWCCPKYGECGYSIGSRPLVGQVNRMWMRQTKRGRAWVREHFLEIRRCTEVVDPPPQTEARPLLSGLNP